MDEPSAIGSMASSSTHHRLLAAEENPVFWVFNISVLVVLGITFLLVMRRNGCKGLYGTEHAVAPGLRDSDVAYARSVLERQRQEDASKKRDPPEIREKKLREWMGHPDYHMMVKESDVLLVSDNDARTVETNSTGDIEAPASEEQQTNDNSPDELDGCDTGKLVLPRTTVANCCAICLCPYESGDQVVWSRDETAEACPHAFHMDCMVEWLVRQYEDDETPCPCCRRDFIHKSIVLAGHQEPKASRNVIFDMTTITLR